MRKPFKYMRKSFSVLKGITIIKNNTSDRQTTNTYQQYPTNIAPNLAGFYKVTKRSICI